MSTWATLQIGNKASVASRLTSNNAFIRPCKIVEVEAENTTGANLWCLFFDGLTAAPANGTVATDGFPVAANSSAVLGFARDTDGGIWCWSTTNGASFTAAGASGSIIVFLKGGS